MGQVKVPRELTKKRFFKSKNDQKEAHMKNINANKKQTLVSLGEATEVTMGAGGEELESLNSHDKHCVVM